MDQKEQGSNPGSASGGKEIMNNGEDKLATLFEASQSDFESEEFANVIMMRLAKRKRHRMFTLVATSTLGLAAFGSQLLSYYQPFVFAQPLSITHLLHADRLTLLLTFCVVVFILSTTFGFLVPSLRQSTGTTHP